MAEPAGDYHRGEMDITEQTRTFHSFISLAKWSSLGIATAVLFLTLLFATGASVLQSLIASVLVAVVGVWLLREKKSVGH